MKFSYHSHIDLSWLENRDRWSAKSLSESRTVRECSKASRGKTQYYGDNQMDIRKFGVLFLEFSELLLERFQRQVYLRIPNLHILPSHQDFERTKFTVDFSADWRTMTKMGKKILSISLAVEKVTVGKSLCSILDRLLMWIMWKVPLILYCS